MTFLQSTTGSGHLSHAGHGGNAEALSGVDLQSEGLAGSGSFGFSGEDTVLFGEKLGRLGSLIEASLEEAPWFAGEG